MNRNDEILVDSLIRLIDAILSVRSSLAHWLMKKLHGEPVARDFAQIGLFRTPNSRKQVWAELKCLSGRDLVPLMQNLLPHRSRRKFLKQVKKKLEPELQQALNHPFMQELDGELEDSMPQVAAQYGTDQRPINERMYPELQCDLNTLCAEPWRIEKAFPIDILKSPREENRLRSELAYNPDNYPRQLISILWQLSNNPYSLGLPPPRSNDQMFKVVGQKPSEDITGRQVGRALVSLFKALGDEEKTKILFEHLIARIIRYQFHLSRDRNVISSSVVEDRQKANQSQVGADPNEEPWEPEDTLSLRGYEDVDYRLAYEALRNRLPLKQKVALDVYLESFETGEPIETICTRKQLSAVAVRNNFQAVKLKVKMGKINKM